MSVSRSVTMALPGAGRSLPAAVLVGLGITQQLLSSKRAPATAGHQPQVKKGHLLLFQEYFCP